MELHIVGVIQGVHDSALRYCFLFILITDVFALFALTEGNILIRGSPASCLPFGIIHIQINKVTQSQNTL